MDEFTVAFQTVELDAHRGREVFPALATRGRPHPLQHLHRVVGVLRRPRFPRLLRDLPPTTWRPLRGPGKPATSLVTRPARHPHNLTEDPALVLLAGLHIRHGVPGGDLGTRRHRQLISHARQCSPFRGHSYVRHGECFTGTFHESRRGLAAEQVSPQDLLSLLDAISPALEAGVAPASALRIAADSRSGSGRPDPLAALAKDMASAAADGATLGPLWRAAAETAGSPELLLLAQAWSLTEDIGAPLAQAVRTTAALLQARIAHERRLVAAVAGAKATVNLLTVLPIAGPLLALVLGIGPAELFVGSRLTQGSLLLGLCLAGIGRWWVRWMVRAVARGPVIV